MSTKNEHNFTAGALILYKQLLAFFPEIELKGKTLPYTSINGNMFTFLDAEGTLAIRLPADDRKVFLKEHHTKLMEAHGTILKEYVSVPVNLLSKTEELKRYFELSLRYAKSLKPKASSKK